MAFHDIAGNGRIKKILRLALGRGRVPNSILFSGPAGVGKRAVARVVAKALNCLQRTDDACDVCDHCRAIDDRRFPDVLEIEPEKDVVKIERMRALKQFAYLKPMAGRKRVFIVDGAEALTEDAAHSLLKILEEPPLFAHIFLVSSNTELLLPTIKSRCQTLAFLPIATEEVERILREQGFAEDKARIIALVVRGDLAQAMTADWDEVEERRRDAWALFRALLANEGASAFLRAYSFQRRKDAGADFGRTLELFASFCRDLLLLKEGADARLLLNPDYESELRACAPRLGFDRMLACAHRIDAALADLDRNMSLSVLASSLYSHCLG